MIGESVKITSKGTVSNQVERIIVVCPLSTGAGASAAPILPNREVIERKCSVKHGSIYYILRFTQCLCLNKNLKMLCTR